MSLLAMDPMILYLSWRTEMLINGSLAMAPSMMSKVFLSMKTWFSSLSLDLPFDHFFLPPFLELAALEIASFVFF